MDMARFCGGGDLAFGNKVRPGASACDLSGSLSKAGHKEPGRGDTVSA